LKALLYDAQQFVRMTRNCNGDSGYAAEITHFAVDDSGLLGHKFCLLLTTEDMEQLKQQLQDKVSWINGV
jgi:hypothetical protein